MQEKLKTWSIQAPYSNSDVSFLDQRKIKIILIALVITIISGFFLLFLLTPSTAAENSSNIRAQELVYLTNLERTNRHLPALAVNSKLTMAAEEKLNHLFDNQYFSHNSPDGKKFSYWVKETEYSYTIVGENLAKGFGTNLEIIDAWMKSDKHRQNILMEPYKEIGIAARIGKFEGKDITIVVQYFGATNNELVSEAMLPFSIYLTKASKLLVKI